MTKPATSMKKQQRAHYSDAYREEALLLAEQVGGRSQPTSATLLECRRSGH